MASGCVRPEEQSLVCHVSRGRTADDSHNRRELRGVRRAVAVSHCGPDPARCASHSRVICSRAGLVIVAGRSLTAVDPARCASHSRSSIAECDWICSQQQVKSPEKFSQLTVACLRVQQTSTLSMAAAAVPRTRKAILESERATELALRKTRMPAQAFVPPPPQQSPRALIIHRHYPLQAAQFAWRVL